MRLIERLELFVLLIFLGLLVLFFSILGIILNKDWNMLILTLYILLLFSSGILIVLKLYKSKLKTRKIEDFEKKLKGRLYHFKCPRCKGIFAIKESTDKNKKSVKITCPDCGILGIIPSDPIKIKGDIPEDKSINVIFRCNNCGEGITIWAEGVNLYNNIYVYSCPFCGNEKPLRRI
jgi:predicted RNA-binding Zn-ribbon protein involved in translation (DUF1610 family)